LVQGASEPTNSTGAEKSMDELPKEWGEQNNCQKKNAQVSPPARGWLRKNGFGLLKKMT